MAGVAILPCLPVARAMHSKQPVKSYPYHYHLLRELGRKQLHHSVAVGRTDPVRLLFSPFRFSFLEESRNNVYIILFLGVQNRTGVVEDCKRQLLTSIQDTQRGFVTTADQRSSIEEALVTVESFDAGEPLELNKLDGTWRLQYTSAPDVLVLLDAASRFPFFQIGQIFQRFKCGDEGNGGVVSNVVKWSLPNLLEEQDGATLVVNAKFSVISLRNIYLQFQEVIVENININEDFQAILSPALLPRTFLSLQVLQFIRTYKVQFPLRSGRRQSAGGLYYLSYLDEDMLLGRAVGGGGVFIFTRAQAI